MCQLRNRNYCNTCHTICFRHYIGGVRYTIIDFASCRLFITNCVFSIISKIYLQHQHNAVNPLAVLSLLRPRLILPLPYLSPIAGIRGAAAGISLPRRRFPCMKYNSFRSSMLHPEPAFSLILFFRAPRKQQIKQYNMNELRL